MSEISPYILNAVQTPTPLRTVYKSVERGNTTEDELIDNTDLTSDLLNQGLTGLRAVGLIGRQEPDYYTVELPWHTGDSELDFRLGVLHNLATDAEKADWGKQSVVLLNYQYLLQEERQAFKSNDGALYERINRWQRDRGYAPRSQQGEIDLNEPKFVNWSRLVDFLGLVHKASGRTHTVYPQPELIAESIRLAANDVGNGTRLTISDYVDWLWENLLLVELTADSNVPATLSRVLFELVRDEQIRIVESGDAAVVGLNGVPRRSGIDKDANSIEVLQ
ncbi:hypothetical protein [Natronocalculus amylovorans]|uniref:Uncharacterized protein n=1 Tax=Natronocalculus amylovorans TaxID=2917812 RepID=A0AAE3FYZ9_9EURY|nr:hypothetical protein [Natronocalculus amylovorans]MCL9817776.1 hypothetical protein [Natronocalculus amylovorans]